MTLDFLGFNHWSANYIPFLLPWVWKKKHFYHVEYVGFYDNNIEFTGLPIFLFTDCLQKFMVIILLPINHLENDLTLPKWSFKILLEMNLTRIFMVWRLCFVFGLTKGALLFIVLHFVVGNILFEVIRNLHVKIILIT